ncbi:DUF4113 domain-containing protein [Aeromonas veronii]|nr:DUF4113 domain-containing protein [Aeromonas veronii]
MIHSLLSRIWRDGHRYQKGGVMLADFTPIGSQQGDLFDHHQHKPRSQDLMQMIDRINQGRLGKIHFGSCGRDNSDWIMRREKLSPRYTTALDELPIAK